MFDTHDVDGLHDRLPTEEESASAKDAATALARAMEAPKVAGVGQTDVAVKGQGAVRIGETDVTLKPAVASVLIRVLGQLAGGKMVTLVPHGALLTTQEAADILNVSRPFLSKLLKQGTIGFVPVGSHRRVRFEDLMRYKRDRDRVANESLDELSRLGQEYDAE